MAWDGLKPHTASQSPCRAPAYRCLLAGDRRDSPQRSSLARRGRGFALQFGD